MNAKPAAKPATKSAAKSATPARRPLISGNWKMNLTHLQAIQLIQQLSYALEAADYEHTEVSVHPPFTCLRALQTLLDADRIPIALGAQNCHQEDAGAFTGEVSAAMLSALDVRYVIVGHSERRELFGESDAVVAAKLKAVLAADMVPILAVGETIEERQQGDTQAKIARQLTSALGDLSKQLPFAGRGAGRGAAGGGSASRSSASRGNAGWENLVVAYEPIWAIGTGRSATPQDAEEVCGFIRSQLAELFDDKTADQIRIQYGGSVKPVTISDLMAQPNIDGALVGGASIEAADFARIVRYRLEG